MSEGKIKLKEISSKEVKKEYSGDKTIFIQDSDNLYPYRIKALIESSKTSFRASRLMSKFIVGYGIEDEELSKKIIDPIKNLDVFSFSHQLAKSISYQDGFFVHISYKIVDAKILPSFATNIPFEDARISKVDDDGFLGKLIVKNWRDSNSFSNKKDNQSSEYYSFSLDQNVLISQISDCYKKYLKSKNKTFKNVDEVNIAEAIKVFSGQYYYYNPYVGEVYPLAKIHACQNDADTEFRIANYTNSQLRKGFLGKSIALTKGLSAEDEEAIEDMLYNMLGEDASSDMIYYPVEELADGEKLEDVIKINQIKPQFDEKFFQETKKDTKSDLMSAFNNIPEAFISSTESFFSSSGEAFEAMKKYYSEQNEEERKAISKFWLDVFGYKVDFLTYGQ